MNWKRGLIRIWLAFSVAWVSIGLGVAIYYGDSSLTEVAQSVFFPPILLLIIGLVMRWIAQGFSNKE
jgi:hypothetical protein